MKREELERIDDEIFSELALGEQQAIVGELSTLWTIHGTYGLFTEDTASDIAYDWS